MALTHPTWTTARLRRVLTLAFGTAGHGRPDTHAAAEAMGVSIRTVQRWLHASPRACAPIPARRLAQLIELTTPSPETLAREATQARYARRAIADLGLPREIGDRPAWKRQRWLEPHIVAVIRIMIAPGLRLRQIVLARHTEEKVRDIRRRGQIVDLAIVPTRLHADALVFHVLEVMGPWRYEAAGDQVRQAFTRTWFDDAPETHLARDGDMIGCHKPESQTPSSR